MIERLIRVGLALAVAFVFTGRMEAAAAHCVQIASAEYVAAPQPEAVPCHGVDETAPVSEQDSHHPAPHSPGQKTCECVAVLIGYASAATAIASAHIEPYEWMQQHAATFVSLEPSPDWRPPRA